MKNPKRLSAAVALALILSISALAEAEETPPCTEPGQILTPCVPSANSQMPTQDNSATPGLIGTPGVSDARTDSSSFTELAASVLQSILPLF